MSESALDITLAAYARLETKYYERGRELARLRDLAGRAVPACAEPPETVGYTTTDDAAS